jgi:hypothetical protein
MLLAFGFLGSHSTNRNKKGEAKRPRPESFARN